MKFLLYVLFRITNEFFNGFLAAMVLIWVCGWGTLVPFSIWTTDEIGTAVKTIVFLFYFIPVLFFALVWVIREHDNFLDMENQNGSTTK